MNYNLTKVLSTDGLDKSGIRLLREAGIEVVEEKMSRAQLIERLPGFDAIIIRSATVIDAEIIKAVCGSSGNRLRIVARAGTGVDNIDMDAATLGGLLVLNTPAANTISAAEHTFALMCCLSRQIPQAYMTMQQGKWDRKSFMGTELKDKTLGIIGLGRIGREIAIRAQAFGMKIVGYDPIVTREEAQHFNVDAMSLSQIWPIADYVTIHVPLLPQTENLINSATYKQCKQGVKIINCSRGGIVNEDDLLEALNSGLCGGAALDVFTQEPPVFGDLIKHPNVISTPHLGASTNEAQYRVAMEIAENLVSISTDNKFCGLVNGHVVNLLQNEESKSWLLILSMLSKSFDVSQKIELFYDDTTIFSKHRGFEDFVKSGLATLLLKDQSGVNFINASIAAEKNNLQISLVKKQKNMPLNVASLGRQVNGHMIEMSAWRNNVYLTRYKDRDLDQPVLLRKGCSLFITNDPVESRRLRTSEAAHIFSFQEDKGTDILVIKGHLDGSIYSGFDLGTSF